MWETLGGLPTQGSKEFKHKQEFISIQVYSLHPSNHRPTIGGIRLKFQLL